MGLADITREDEDARLREDIENAFSLLSDVSILRVATALSGASPSSIVATIIHIIGPEDVRVASVLPAMIAPLTMADPAIAAQAVAALSHLAGQPKPTQADVKATIDKLKRSGAPGLTTKDVEHAVGNIVEWSGLAAFIVSLGITALTSRGSAARLAGSGVRRLLMGGAAVIGGVAGAIAGYESDHPDKPPVP